MIEFYSLELNEYIANLMIEMAQREQKTIHLGIDDQDIYAMATDRVGDILKQYKKRFYDPPLKEMKIINLDSFFINGPFGSCYNALYKKDPNGNLIAIPAVPKNP